MAMVLHSSSQ